MRLRSLAAASLASAAAVLALAQGPRVRLIHLDPQPAISGGCPARLHFTGHIETTGPMNVQYQWLRSDGSHTDHTVRAAKASTIPVSANWSISSHYSGWMQLVIVAPNHLQTARAAFTVNCGK